MSAGDRDTLAALLAEHRVWMGDHSAVCNCGHELPLYDFNGEQYRAHLADVLLASDWLTEVKAGAWDEGHGVGFNDCSRYLAALESNKYPRPEDTQNPYRTTENTEPTNHR